LELLDDVKQSTSFNDKIRDLLPSNNLTVIIVFYCLYLKKMFFPEVDKSSSVVYRFDFQHCHKIIVKISTIDSI